MLAIAKKRARRINPKYIAGNLPNIITYDWLRGLQACWGQRTAFNSEWPLGCQANKASLKRAIEIGLDLTWLFNRLVRVDNRTWFAKQYEHIRAKFRHEMSAGNCKKYTTQECRARRNKRVAKLFVQVFNLK